MSLNIKNERVHDLVREAARRTGLNQTSVVEHALRRFLDGLDDQPGTERARLIADLQHDVARGPALDLADLHDEAGLPR